MLRPSHSRFWAISTRRLQMYFQGEMPISRLHQCGQAVYLLAHVRITAGDVVVLYAAEIKHG